MKRFCAVILCVVMLLSTIGGFSVSAAGELMNISHETLPLLNAVATVQSVSGDSAIALVQGDDAPGQIYVNASEVDDLTALLTACLENNVIPVVNIEEPAHTSAVITAYDQSKCFDLTVTSSNDKLLRNVRKQRTYIRTGLVVDLESDTLSSEEAHAVRTAVRGAPATFCVLRCDDASRQAVAELQELAVAVWVQVDTAADSDAFAVDALRAVTSGANGIICNSTARLAAVLNETLEPSTISRTPVLIGHRGNPTQAPENSLSGFITAYENGADIIEIDVDITADGEVIIMHDDTLNRTTDYTGDKTVGQMTLAEVKECRLLGLDGKVTDETVPTLRELLTEFQDKDCRIFVEFKGYKQQNVTTTAAVIKELGMEDRVDVISFSTSLIQHTQNELDGMSTGYLHSASGTGMNAQTSLFSLYLSLGQAQTINSSINPNKAIFTKYYAQAAADRGMTVWPWTYYENGLDKIFLLCPDGLTTDDAQWAKDMAKYVEASADAAVIAPGTTTTLTVKAVTYGGDATALDPDKMIVKVLDGEEFATVDGTTVTALKHGTVSVMYGFKTTTADGSDYVLYSQPVTITVGDPAPATTTTAPSATIPASPATTVPTPDDTASGNLVLWIVLGGVVLAAVIGVVIFAICYKPNKKPKSEE